MSVILGIIMIALSVGAFKAIWEAHDSEMKKKIDMFDEQRRPPEEINFANFENSLNIIFGIANYDAAWDILNNPYVVYTG